MEPDETAAKVLEILRANPDGLSRAGLLAWARLRVAPDLTDAQLDEAMARLGPAVSTQGGFVRLVPAAPADAPPPRPATPAPTTSLWVPPQSTPWTATTSAPPPPSSSGGTFSTATLVSQHPAAPPLRLGPSPVRRAWSIAGVIVFILLAALGAANRSGGTATPAPSPLASDARGTMTSVDGLAVGMCFAVPAASTFSEVEILRCDAAHDGEVVSVFDDPAVTGATYRTDAQWDSEIGPRCERDVDAYVGGRSKLTTAITYGWFVPDTTGWSNGARTVQCYLTPQNAGTLSRSYRAGR
ncbi:MAG TPA: septum formation family protein [Candidatus Dormibacteraeota bacterium]|nr:septum formation family protein [Candidatus Dormibacteraeota bacterium]